MPTPLDLPGLPPPLLRIVDKLADAGHTSLLVGVCLRERMAGRSPSEFEVSTTATLSEVLDLFPRSVPTRPGNAMVPTPAGPVDVTSTPRGQSPEDTLNERDVTIHAMGYDPKRRELHDPFDGRSDLANGLLRSVGPAADAFSKDALVALRVVRLVATLSFEVEEDLERALREVGSPLRRIAPLRLRYELSTTLLAPSASEALHLMKRTGIEEIFAPGVSDDAPGFVRRLPVDLTMRLTGWLRGTHAGSILRKMRYSRPLVARVEGLVRMHPIDADFDAGHKANLHRLIKRTSEEDIEALFVLRRAELTTTNTQSAQSSFLKDAAATHLDALAAALDQLRVERALKQQRNVLALDGAALMAFLDCEPGPIIGRALRHLTERVTRDPSLNTRAALEGIVRKWARENES